MMAPMGIEVVWLDGTMTVWPTAATWTAYRAGIAGKEAAFTGDLALLDADNGPLAIIGAGTFRWIGRLDAAQLQTGTPE